VNEPVLDNRSRFCAEVLPILDTEGAAARLVVVKATFSLRSGQAPRLAQEPVAVRLGPEYWGAPELADLRRPADFGLPKQGSDFLLAGHAVPAAGQVVRSVDVQIRVAERVKLIRAFGPRWWRRGFVSVVPSAPEQLESVPLAWSRAWGGIDLSDPDRPLEEARNPHGSGVCHRPASLADRPAPQIECPDNPVRSAGSTGVPCGCAPIGPQCEPRRGLAGTYDRDWLEQVYPGRPADYAPQHENCATLELQFADGLHGGEDVQLHGVSTNGPIAFKLPRWRVRVTALIGSKLDARLPGVDTVIVDSDALTLELVWRALYRCPASMQVPFPAIRVEAKEYLS
jgi:hypothetical protein